MKIKRKNIELGIILGLVFAIVMSFARFDAACEDLRTNVLRLHIIANSDSGEDQRVKFAVRDAILNRTGDLFLGVTALEEAENKALDSLEEIEASALETLKENGFDYGVSAYIGNSYFENREYEDFTLPAGNYRSLIIRLGEGKGENWWCVVFPAVCVPAASDVQLSDTTANYSANIASKPQKYVIKFKTIELYEDIKHYLDKHF